MKKLVSITVSRFPNPARFLGNLLPLLLLVALAGAAQAQFTYTTNKGTITITGYTGPGDAVEIPSMINGLPVTSIEDGAFSACSKLTSITIPNSVTTIGGWAFQFCSSLTNVTIGTSVTSIRSAAFSGCSNLTSVTIPNSVTNIEVVAFSYCTSLAAITVDALNRFYSSVDGVLFNKSHTTLVEYPCGPVGSYTIPNSVSTIGDYAFDSCSKLTSVTLGTNVTRIGNQEFGWCTTLTNVTIPNSVSSIGWQAFEGCSKLASVTIPNSVTTIEYRAFAGCGLTSITIPDSITSVGDHAFDSCPSLTTIYFRGNAPSLGGAYVFYADDKAIVYYLPGATSWGITFGGLPTALWDPQPQSMGVQSNQFGFTITGTTNIPIAGEASVSLATSNWTALQTCNLTNGSIYFSDAAWTNYPNRFYRIRSP